MAGIQIVVFELDGNEYGIDSLAVNGILRAKKYQIKKVPGMTDCLEGIINLRGQVNYIFNLKKKFGMAETEIHEESKFIMLNTGEAVAGCIVDEVTDIIKLEDEQMQQSPAFAKASGSIYIKGIGKVDDRIIILLDPEKILSVNEQEVLDSEFIKSQANSSIS
ncbi:MAG: chemotaxis protein CheW [Pelosinus sp.]|nr:chemotaxis protein CheW [Pelosinus sp.]